MLNRKSRRGTPLVMVVDDDHAVRLLARETLEFSGFTVWDAESGEQALEAFEEKVPDIVLLDLNMPTLDGFAVLKLFRELSSPDDFLPVLILTGDSTADIRRRALLAGAIVFLGKPVDRCELILRF